MNSSPIRAIVITGHYAAGKGEVARELHSHLDASFPTINVIAGSDREFLNTAVLRDIFQPDAPRPGVEGLHSIIRDMGPPLVFDVKDGSLHHEAHTNMIRSIGAIPDGTVAIYEIASGPDVSAFQLFQSGEHLVKLLEGFVVIDSTLVVDVTAPYAVRLERNAQRPDRVSEKIMAVAATAGGEVFGVRHRLGEHYYRLDNTTHGGLSAHVFTAFDTFIRPNLETTLAILEGTMGHNERFGW